MPDPIPPQGPVPTTPANPATPGLTPADLQSQQAAQAAERLAGDLANQKNAQKKAEKGVFKRIQNQTVKPGSLIAFQYAFYEHDPTPLVLVGRINDWSSRGRQGMFAGINLHYLTFKYMKYLLDMFCGKNFNYALIKGNKYIVNSYRSYKREGRKQLRMVDCDFLNSILKTTRSYKPSELEAIRKEVQRQLQEKLHPNAEEFAKQYQEAIYKQSHRKYNIGKEQPDGRLRPTDVTPPTE